MYFPFSINSFFLRSAQNPPSLKPTTYYSYVHLYFTYTSLSNNCNKTTVTTNKKIGTPKLPCQVVCLLPTVGVRVTTRPVRDLLAVGKLVGPFRGDVVVPQGETCACTPSDGLGGTEQPDVGKSLGTELPGGFKDFLFSPRSLGK